MIDDVLKERSKTHGNFKDNAYLVEEVMHILENTSPNWGRLTYVQSYGIRMVISKISRALSGDHLEVDHYIDAAGYLKLIANDVEKQKNERVSFKEGAKRVKLKTLCDDILTSNIDVEV